MSTKNNSAYLKANGVFTEIRDLTSKDDDNKLWKRAGKFAVLGFTIDVEFPDTTTLATPKPHLMSEGEITCSLMPHYKGGVAFLISDWSPSK